jgi:hypothetical protein
MTSSAEFVRDDLIYFISRANLIGVRANVPILYSNLIGESMRKMPLGK